MSYMVTPVIGLPQQRGWSQVLEAEHSPLVIALAISGDNAGNVGRDLADQIREARLNSAAGLHTFLKRVQAEITDKDCRWSMAAVLETEDQAILAAHQGVVLLKRQEKVGRLLDRPSELLVVEGQLQAGDVAVLATDAAETLLGEVQQKLIQGYDVDTIVTSVVPGVHSLADSSTAALAFLSLKEVALDAFVSPEAAEPASPIVPAVAPQTPQEEVAPKQPSWLSQVQRGAQAAASSAVGASAGLFSLGNRRAVYVTTSPSRRLMRKVLPALIIVLVIAGLGVNWFLRRSRSIAQAEQQLAPVQEQLILAQAEFEEDPIAARETVQAALSALTQIENNFQDQGAALAKIKAVRAELEAYSESISGREEVKTLPQFYDLREANAAEDFITTAADVRGTVAYFLDGERRQVIRLDLETKQQQVYTLGEGSRLTDIAALDDGALVLGENLLRLTEDVDVEPLTVRAAEDQLRGSRKIDVFGQSAYVVNPDERTIFRYTPQEAGGYGDPDNWLQTAADFAFENVLSMQIDSDIWLTNAEGQLARFRSGRPRDFELRGVPDEIDSALRLFTSEESDLLYVLDADRERLLLITKEGEFVREVSSGSLAAGSHLIVSEELNKAFVVSGATVFEIELGSNQEPEADAAESES